MPMGTRDRANQCAKKRPAKLCTAHHRLSQVARTVNSEPLLLAKAQRISRRTHPWKAQAYEYLSFVQCSVPSWQAKAAA